MVGRRVGVAGVCLAAVVAFTAACSEGGQSTTERTTTAARGTTATVATGGKGGREFVGTVRRVVDGDTIHVRSGDEDLVVRLIGIDTPETRRSPRGAQCWGDEATARTSALIGPGARVRLRTDPTQDLRDRYGRLLAHVHRGSTDGADSVNRQLVAEGMARVYIYRRRPFTDAAAFQRAEREAQRAGRGLWGPPCRGER